jgi:hypothetical protein
MAIVFSKDISTTKLLMAYNNHFVKFNSDSEKTPLNCTITGIGVLPIIIYPHPDGSFLFNLSEYVRADINTNNFADNLVTDLQSSDDTTFTYDVSDNSFLNPTVNIKITFTDESFETITRTLKFIAGVENLESYKKNEIIISEANYLILSPVEDRTNNKTYLKYWEGYPFEFSFYTNYPADQFKLINTTNGLDYEFQAKGHVTSLFISDGRTDVTLEDFIPLAIGYNQLRIEHEETLQENLITIQKVDTECGIYLKFLNQYGRWNYWLMSNNHFRNRSSRSIGQLDNNFNNLEDTISPMIEMGKNSQDTIKCIYERMNANDKRILDGIIESPKIYMFTGERFSRANANDWVEVSLKTNSFVITKPSTELYTMQFEIELPERYTIQL